jgi:hypothetical protein
MSRQTPKGEVLYYPPLIDRKKRLRSTCGKHQNRGLRQKLPHNLGVVPTRHV